MNNDIGRMRCPVCGTQTGARKNKNGIIYTNCPNGHQSKLNKPDSHEAAAALDSGKAWNNGLVFIYPLEKQTERKQENDGNDSRNDRTSGQCINYGRTDGQSAPNSAANNGNTDTNSELDESDDDDFGFGLI